MVAGLSSRRNEFETRTRDQQRSHGVMVAHLPDTEKAKVRFLVGTP
jgi:hypothetical protein